MERAQVAFGDRQRQPDRRLARVTVEVGGDEQRRDRQRVVGRKARALAAREAVARFGTGAALGDAVGIGERQRGAGRETRAASGCDHRAEALRLDADRGDGRGRLAQGGEAEREVGATAAQRVAGFEQGREVGGEATGAAGRCFEEHVAEAGMHRQGRQPAAVIGDPADGVEGAEVGEECAGLGEGGRGRRGEEGEGVGAGGAPEREVEREAGEIGAGDLGRRERP